MFTCEFPVACSLARKIGSTLGTFGLRRSCNLEVLSLFLATPLLLGPSIGIRGSALQKKKGLVVWRASYDSGGENRKIWSFFFLPPPKGLTVFCQSACSTLRLAAVLNTSPGEGAWQMHPPLQCAEISPAKSNPPTSDKCSPLPCASKNKSTELAARAWGWGGGTHSSRNPLDLHFTNYQRNGGMEKLRESRGSPRGRQEEVKSHSGPCLLIHPKSSLDLKKNRG